MGQLRNLGFALFVTVSAVNAQTVTIAALGDSLTAGYGLARSDGFVPQLQAWLAAQGADVKIKNAGVSGDTTAGGRARVAWTLTNDVDAMIVTLGGNDYLRGLDPAVSRANLDSILAAGQQAGVRMLLIGIVAGSNYGAQYKQQFDSMYVDLAAKYDVPLYQDFFGGLRSVIDTQNPLATFMQADGIHPNKQGVTAIVDGIGPFVLKLAQPAE